MGLLDILKKKDRKITQGETENKQEVEQLPFEFEFSRMNNGNLQVDFYDKNADFKKFYDSTRLIIGRQPLNIEGRQVYNCAVSWYGYDDHKEFNPKIGRYDSTRAQEYRGVLAEIDLGLLQSDPSYLNMLMSGLLDKERVERYLESGLQEEPETPCGKYIGGVIKTEEGYCKKIFSMPVGRASHNSELMVNRRQERRAQIEAQRQKNIADKKAQIEKLQSEIEDIEK